MAPLLRENRSAQYLCDIVNPEYCTDDAGEFDLVKCIINLVNRAPPKSDAKFVKKTPGSDDSSHSSAYRSIRCGDGVITQITPDVENMVTTYQRSVELFGDRDCLGTRRVHEDGTVDNFFTFESYNTVFKRRDHIGSGLRTLVGRHDKFIVSIYAPNRPEWVITLLACQGYDMIYTALYDTLGPKASSYILNLTESPVIVTSRANILKVIELKKTNGLPHLKYIVSMDPLDIQRNFGLISHAESNGLRLIDFKQLEQLGTIHPMPLHNPHPDEVFGISFTSGTTGNPKGVEITHRMGTAYTAFGAFSLHIPVSAETQVRVMSFLPLAHIYEIANLSIQLLTGASIGFMPDPNPAKLVENLSLFRPHVMAFVPRVFTKVEAALKESLSGSMVGRKVLSGVEEKMQRAKTDGPVHSTLLDKFALKPLQKKLGFDECVLMCSGSAPITAETAAFLRATMDSGFSQGYGLTESMSGVSIDMPYETDVSCGPVHLTTELRLRDIPEMNYYTHGPDGKELEEPQGELLLRGPQIFKKYFKNEEATKDAFDEQGWFKTGDVARLDKRGRIHIIDRVKNFFKLAQGEYVTPERIENTYLSVCPFVTQVFVHGNSHETYLVSIVGIEPALFRAHLSHKPALKHLAKLSDDELLVQVNKPDVKRQLLLEMNHRVTEEGLHGFEKIQNVVFMIEPLRMENETITPTLKIKRSFASKYFKEVLDELYAEGSITRTKL